MAWLFFVAMVMEEEQSVKKEVGKESKCRKS
jgi:hypothetical protein